MRSSLPTLLSVAAALALGACGDGHPTEPVTGVWTPAVEPVAASSHAALEPGMTAPDLTGWDVSGTPTALSDLAGAFVLLEVGGVWCAPSQYLAPILPQVDQEMAEDGIPFLSVTALVDGTTPDVASTGTLAQAWLDAFHGGQPRPVLHMNGDETAAGAWRDAVAGYGGIPVLFLLDPAGNVLRAHLGAMDLAPLLAWIREGVAAAGNPAIQSLQGPEGPVAVGQDVPLSGSWTSPDGVPPAGTVDWGDGTTSPLTVNGDGTFTAPARSYAAAGFYEITVTLETAGGGTDDATLSDVVVYDPDGGFAVASGTVVSPTGVCAPEVCGDGESPARFRLMARYARGASTPSGEFSFGVEGSDFAFESTAFDWLLVDGDGTGARLEGTGRITGFGPDVEAMTFRFALVLTDGGPDDLALQIWMEDGGFQAVYGDGLPMEVVTGNVMVKGGR